ncbi:hypothetical protein D6850_16925 [Roseovarius spongiae]|uniref:Uncharacterized protein n=1 Tax=Roseovarius spongiae TaxID=2320272 RepID=A0A3A8B7E9_9RHOB|nr:hypothetical protein D6850_16925 [Roseovarius spongiae]
MLDVGEGLCTIVGRLSESSTPTAARSEIFAPVSLKHFKTSAETQRWDDAAREAATGPGYRGAVAPQQPLLIAAGFSYDRAPASTG